MNHNIRTIELKPAFVHLRNDGIMHLHIKPRAEIDIKNAKEMLHAMFEIGGGQKYPVLIDAGDFVRIDPDVRVFSASEEGNICTLADAIAYNSLAQKLIANFYVFHNKPVIPTQIFSDRNEAIEWLKRFVKVA